MDFLKRHYEKLILALALMILIGAAAYLVSEVGKLDREIKNTPTFVPSKGKGIPPVHDAHYKRALAALRNPAVWTNTAHSMFVPYEPLVTNLPPTGADSHPPPVKVIYLRQVVSQRFGLLFKAYRWNEETKTASQFQINLRTKNTSFFVPAVGDPIEDRFEKTGYKIVNFERKTKMVAVPGLPNAQEDDISELTVQKDEGKPVTLILNKVAEPDPVAHIQCGQDGPISPLKVDDTFTCFGKTHKVVDIVATQVIILDIKTGEKQTLPLTRNP